MELRTKLTKFDLMEQDFTCPICDEEFPQAGIVHTNAGELCKRCWDDGSDLYVCAECGNISEFGWNMGFRHSGDNTVCGSCREVDTAVEVYELTEMDTP